MSTNILKCQQVGWPRLLQTQAHHQLLNLKSLSVGSSIQVAKAFCGTFRSFAHSKRPEIEPRMSCSALGQAACAFSASAATLEGRACTTRSLLTLTMPGGAPLGLDTSLARATMTGGLPSFCALEKYAARLAAKVISSGAGSLQLEQAVAEITAAIQRSITACQGHAPGGRHAQDGV